MLVTNSASREFSWGPHSLLFSSLFHAGLIASMLHLLDSEASMRLEQDGRNELTPKKGKPEWLKFLSQVGRWLFHANSDLIHLIIRAQCPVGFG